MAQALQVVEWRKVLPCRRHGRQTLVKAVPVGREHPVTRVTNQHQGTDFITRPVRVSQSSMHGDVLVRFERSFWK